VLPKPGFEERKEYNDHAGVEQAEACVTIHNRAEAFSRIDLIRVVHQLRGQQTKYQLNDSDYREHSDCHWAVRYRCVIDKSRGVHYQLLQRNN
jgi:hypothetical protein